MSKETNIYVKMSKGRISTKTGALVGGEDNTHESWEKFLNSEWLWLVGSIKRLVCFAKEPYKRNAILRNQCTRFSYICVLLTS